MTAAGALPPVRKVGRGPTLAYGFGAVAYGVKDNGFGTFLLLFYNQVVGLPSATVGLVIMAALIFDAFIDPAVGVLSDRTRSRWGRRHPWMYSAALPIAAGWLLLWNPPSLSEPLTLVWLFATAVAVRTAVSCYEVPSQALTPELSADYDERTRITSYRYLFGWAGGLTALFAAYAIFLTPETPGGNGLLNRPGYSHFALATAIAMAVAIIVSALGTHGEIRHLPKQAAPTGSVGAAFRELLETVKNRAFVILMLAGLCVYTNQGISFSLSNYLYSFVWRFSGGDFTWLALVLFAGVCVSFGIAPPVARRIGKPRAAAIFAACSAVLLTLPYWLRFAGLFPEPGSPILLPALFGIFIFHTGCSVSAMILGASMMADVVEHSEAHTGRRSEGVFFAGGFFIQKCTSGVGIAISGLVLWAANFPAAATPGEVPVPVIDRLTLIYCVIYLCVGLLGAWLYSRFPFGRDEHMSRVEAMGGSAGEASMPIR
ncbi:MFS transporter [Stakelama marina]|uniref:MFS transporter n=1 Tax=Stakelama marina TaxID=2826939 RepID=A0A8T4IFF0_9SPHN|nr:MFS transporter [Stakelama marina]MBR0553347.1 MFS transporter [Stakelama marina]